MWQENMVLMSIFVHGATRMVRAASSNGELDVYSAKLAGIVVQQIFYLIRIIVWNGSALKANSSFGQAKAHTSCAA